MRVYKKKHDPKIELFFFVSAFLIWLGQQHIENHPKDKEKVLLAGAVLLFLLLGWLVGMAWKKKRSRTKEHRKKRKV